MNLLFTKATIIELVVLGLGYYKFPYATLSLLGMFAAVRIYPEFSKIQSKKVEKILMNAIHFHPSIKDSYISKNINIPKFSKNQILVQVKAASINPVDYKVVTPLIPFMRWINSHSVGRDFSGVIIDVGPDVTQFKIGEEVYGNASGGSLQEYTVVNEYHIGHKPSTLNFKETAAIGLAGATSLQCLHWFGEISGKKVLIIGASGGCGSLGVQIAKYYNAKVYGVCSSRNAEYVKSIGADVIVDYTKPDYLDIIKNENFDLIFDTVSSAEDGDQEIKFRPLLKQGGKYVAINGKPLDFLRGMLKFDRKDYHLHLLSWKTKDLEKLRDIAEKGKLVPKIHKTFYLESRDVKNAFDELKSRRTTGKIVIEI